LDGLHSACRQLDDRDAFAPIHGNDLARRMLDLDVVEKHHLQDLGDRIAADGSGLNLCAHLRAQLGELGLLECRWRLGVRDRSSYQDDRAGRPRYFS
jgi:hypothetical protein